MAGIERLDVRCYTALLSQKSVVCQSMRRFVCGLLCPKTEQSPYDRIASGNTTISLSALLIGKLLLLSLRLPWLGLKVSQKAHNRL